MSLSIIILYSPDRRNQLYQTLNCLADLKLFSDCEVIICVDGKNNIDVPYKVVEVPRNYKFFCWGDAIEIGLNNSKYQQILYIDSDRILPTNFLIFLKENMDNKNFCFPKRLFQFKKNQDISVIKNVRDNFDNYKDLVFEDSRVYSHPLHAIRRKNPLSGCVGFTKEGYYSSGGFDKSFIGWGFPDIDFFMTLHQKKYNFIPIDCNELHLSHPYYNFNYMFKNNRSLVRLMGLFNGLKFCKKWKIPVHDSIKLSANEMNIDVKDVGDNLKNFLHKFNQHQTKLI